MGLILKRKGNFEEAEKEFQTAIIKGYNKTDCLLFLFELYLEKNDIEKAETLLNEFQRVKDFDENQIEILKNILLTKDREKLAKITDQIKIRVWYYKNSIPTLLDIMNKRAFSYIEKGEIEKGIEMWKKAIDVDSTSFYINYNLSLVLFDLGRLDESMVYCRSAILSGDPEYIHWAHNLMGNILYYQKNYIGALNAYKKAIEIEPSFAIAHYNLGSTFDMLGDKENAEKHWILAIEYENIKGKGKESEERVKEGKMEIFIYVEERRAAFLARKSLGFLYRDKGLKERAIEELESALELIPTDPEIHYELGLIYMGLKNKEKAIFHFENAIKNGTSKEREALVFLKELKEK